MEFNCGIISSQAGGSINIATVIKQYWRSKANNSSWATESKRAVQGRMSIKDLHCSPFLSVPLLALCLWDYSLEVISLCLCSQVLPAQNRWVWSLLLTILPIPVYSLGIDFHSQDLCVCMFVCLFVCLSQCWLQADHLSFLGKVFQKSFATISFLGLRGVTRSTSWICAHENSALSQFNFPLYLKYL